MKLENKSGANAPERPAKQRYPISQETINVLRANFLLNKLPISEIARVLDIDRKSVVNYYDKFREILQTDPQRLYRLNFTLYRTRTTTVKFRKKQLKEALPELACKYTGKNLSARGMYREYVRAFPDSLLCDAHFAPVFKNGCKSNRKHPRPTNGTGS